MSINLRLTPVMLGGILLTVLYVGFYLSDSAMPGNTLSPNDTHGWLAWWDQGRYYDSAAALAAGNLNPAMHFTPLGYSLLAMPFERLGNQPFFMVDLAGLLITYAAFVRFAPRVGVSGSTAAVLFLLTSCADPFLFRQWVIPWSSSVSAALTWTLLAVSAAHLQGRRRPFVLGLLAAALPLVRPPDAILGAICLAWLAIVDLRRSTLRWRDIVAVAVAVAFVIVPFAVLYLNIYGPRPTPYMITSSTIGFTVHNPLWRAYVLLIEPRQWFFAGHGMLANLPWLVFGFAGAVCAWRYGLPAALLAVCLTVYCLFYLAYVDLLPTALWRYMTIHYFKWTLPGFGLLGWLLIRDLARVRPAAWAALAVVLLLSCIRVTPRLAGPDELANAIDIPGPVATEHNTTMAPPLAVVDAKGALPNISNMRAFPLPGGDGVRIIGLKRDFAGTLAWVPGRGMDMPENPSPQRRWTEQIGFGYPCWLPPLACKHPVMPPS